ncbi:MAG TPA: hypothetical protein VGB87_21355 [Vicinamibacteria bacterium]
MTAKPRGGNGHYQSEGGGHDVRRYLLGFMSEAEEARVERAYLASDEALEELRVHEDELIEDYLRGALERGERAAFERVFLASPGRLERLVFLRALQDRVGESGPAAAGRFPAVRPWGLAAAGFGALAVAGLLAARGSVPSPASDSPRGTPARQEMAIAPPVPGGEGQTASAPPLVRLRAPAVRGAGEAPTVDAGSAGHVALEAPLEAREDLSAHRGRVIAPDGREVFVSAWQPSREETTLRVLVPTAVLGDGRHVLVVETSDGRLERVLESYAFHVRRR